MEQALNDFCSRNKIAAVEKEFVTDGARSFWSICISYLDTGQKTSDSYKKTKIDWERAYMKGDVNKQQLQRAYDSVHSLTVHANAQAWRRLVRAFRFSLQVRSRFSLLQHWLSLGPRSTGMNKRGAAPVYRSVAEIKRGLLFIYLD